MKEAYNSLLSGNKIFYTKLGFFALGDAYLISGENPAYKDEIVLVEHREKHQYNHWGFRFKSSDRPNIIPTITTNGDDDYGNLKCKAPRQKLNARGETDGN